MSLSRRQWMVRFAFRVYLLLLCSLGVVAFLEILQGDFLHGAVALAVLLADFAGFTAVVVGIAGCLLVGAYAAALLAAAIVALRLFGRLRGRADFDPEGLAAITTFPPGLRKQLQGASAGGPITTRSMLALALAVDPAIWKPLLGRDPGVDAFDGPLLRSADGSECSQYAAEALAIAGALGARLERPLDAELLAVAAAMVPLAAASDWLHEQGLPEEVVRASPGQLASAATGFATTAAGADMFRRLETVVRAGTRGEGEQREQLATVGHGTLARFEGLAMGVTAIATVYAYVAVFGELVLDLLRWLLSLPRWLLRLPGRIWRALFAAPGRDRIARRWCRLAAPWADWPPPASLLWLLGRPLLGLAAVVCVVGSGSLPIWLGLPLGIAAATVRSVRWPWLSLAAAAAVFPVSPPGAAILALRALLGEVIVWWLGRGDGAAAARRRGLRMVVAARLTAGGGATGYPAENLAAARSEFGEAIGGDDEDAVMERATVYGVAAWASWHWLELLALVMRVTRGVLRGQWAGPVEEAGIFDREFMSLALVEELLEASGRWLALLVAAAAAFFVVADPEGLLGGEDLIGRLAAAVAVLPIALPLTRREIASPMVQQRQISFTAAVFWAAVAWLALGSQVWQVVAIAVAAAFVSQALRRLTETFSFSGRSRWRTWPPPKARPWRLRRHWQAASKAIEDGDERLGVEMLKDLARAAGGDEVYATAAIARAALVEVDLGRLQDAAAHLDEISAASGELEGTAAVAAGMLASTLGDYERATRMLRKALANADSSSPLVPRATLALAEALARAGRPDEALDLITGYGARPFALRGVAAMLEAQVTVAAALIERGRGNDEEKLRAVSLLTQFDSIVGPGETDLPPGLSPEVRRRMQRAQGQLLALRGQLLLEREPSKAVRYLEQATGLAAEAGDEALRAGTQVLHGSALARSPSPDTGTTPIVRGVEVLESRRTQLRAGERRTAMIAAGEPLYSAALSGFLASQEKGCPRAGMEAARLVESLRQNALASALRAGSLPLDDATEQLIGKVVRGERGDVDVDELRTVIRERISDRFAAAYLPSSVTIGRLRQACRGFDHVLAFHVPPGGLPGWRAWITSEGAGVGKVGAGAELDPLLAALTSTGKLPDEQLHWPLAYSSGIWERLGEELLPLGMRQALLRADPARPQRILVVPDGALALVPWAALRIGGRPLVESAAIQVIPALELSGSAEVRGGTEQVLAHLPDAGDGAELEGLRHHGGLEVATSRDGFLRALESRRFGGAYMASHGREVGMRQQVEFADGSSLSAASALAYEWPAWTVFSSCLVGRVEQVAGREPFGLAISCMLRGTDTVLASVVELSEEGALACGEATAALAAGEDPGEALRSAQLRQLERRQLSSLADGLGLVCISTAAPGSLGRGA